MPRRLVLATRGSALALAQSRWVMERLREAHPDAQIELSVIRTKGDGLAEAPLPAIGGKGLFTAELEQALLEGSADFAVHSLKDLPTAMSPGLAIAAYTERADPRDVLISRSGADLDGLPEQAVIGTSSPRRTAQLAHRRPDLRFAPLRGNVETRLRKLHEQALDGIVLAAAGLLRLGLEDAVTQWLPTSVCLPAAGQGILAVQARADDAEMSALLAAVDARASRLCARAERAALVALGGGCRVPVGLLAQVRGAELVLEGVVLGLSGEPCVRARVVGELGCPEHLGRRLAEKIGTEPLFHS